MRASLSASATTTPVSISPRNTPLPEIPKGTQPGTTLRIKGKGAPKLNQRNNRGDHYVTVKVRIPKELSKEEEGILRQLDEVAA